MKKLLITFCLVACVVLSASAGTLASTQTITINGETVDKVAAQLTFDGDNVILHFTDGTTQSADMDEVAITFETATSISNISVFNLKNSTDGNLDVTGIKAGQKIEIYDITGKKVMQGVATEQSTHIDLAGVKSGVYILRAGNNIVKFVKR